MQTRCTHLLSRVKASPAWCDTVGQQRGGLRRPGTSKTRGCGAQEAWLGLLFAAYLEAVLLSLELCREVRQDLLVGWRQPRVARLVLAYYSTAVLLVREESLDHALKVPPFRLLGLLRQTHEHKHISPCEDSLKGYIQQTQGG